ncbi:helix-turn-helix transcriptional regulator [Yoonia sp. SDW83-1]|uniref:helix-turn-helix transcriptional regulator n=1 Tax=Yoonia sp. SDW83-1 TaxID=3366945 RepID=UPI00398C6150
MSEQYLNVEQLRAKLGNRSLSSINRDIANGTLPAPIILGRKRYWPLSAVDARMAEKFEMAQSDAE